MNNRIQLTKAFNDLKDLFYLKDIHVAFWSGRSGSRSEIYQYKSRPYLRAITNDNRYINLYVAHPRYKFDYAYVDEFNKSKYIPNSPFVAAFVPIQPWQIAKSLFNIAQQSPIYLFMSNEIPLYCNKNQHILLNKGIQLYEFLVYADMRLSQQGLRNQLTNSCRHNH